MHTTSYLLADSIYVYTLLYIVFTCIYLYTLLFIQPQDLRIELADRGPVSDAARSGEAVHAHGGKGGKGGAMPSMLCMPVFGADGQVAGVVQVVGKKTGGRVPNG